MQIIKGWLLFSLALIFPAIGFPEKPAGFLWYNLKEQISDKAKETKKPGIPFNHLSFTARDKVLRFYTMEALHKARHTQSVNDMKVFLSLQDYWLKSSSRFAETFQKTMRYYPDFDYTVTHPISNLGTKMVDEWRMKRREQMIKRLAKSHGLLFFYRGKNPYDLQQIPIVRDFCKRFQFPLIPVSVDGVNVFGSGRLNQGQAESLGVRYFPALLLVNPKTQQTQPVVFGLTTQDVLELRLTFAANTFSL